MVGDFDIAGSQIGKQQLLATEDIERHATPVGQLTKTHSKSPEFRLGKALGPSGSLSFIRPCLHSVDLIWINAQYFLEMDHESKNRFLESRRELPPLRLILLAMHKMAHLTTSNHP